MNLKTIVDNVYYIGVNDRQKESFENYIPLPHGVSYNSYVIVDEKIAIMDTVDITQVSPFLAKLELALQGRDADYLVVHHMEPDHAGSIELLLQKYPNLQIITSSKSKDMLKGYFNITENITEVKEGEKLSLGERELTFYMAPMVHWPEVMVSFESKDKILFSADAFGTFSANDGGYIDADIKLNKYWNEMRRYYACIVGKFAIPVQNAIKKLSALPIEMICTLHGPVWKQEMTKVISMYDKWSRFEPEEDGLVIAYGTMYGNTQQMAEAVAEGAVAAGLKTVVVYNVSKTDASYILADIFRFKGIVIGSPTYMGEMYPLVEQLVLAIEHRGVANRIYGCFGSYTWASKATKMLTELPEKLKWEMMGSVDNKQAVSVDKYHECYELGVKMAEAILKK